MTTKLTLQQIEAVVNWMNDWEQLKDTSIPLRFKEDFMTTINRPRPSKKINLREKRRMREERKLELFYGWWMTEGINKPRTLIGDEVED